MLYHQPTKRRAKQPWVVVDDEDMSSSDPGTPRQLMTKSRSKIVTLLHGEGKEIKTVEVTDSLGNKSYYPLDNPESHKTGRRPGAASRIQPRWRRLTRHRSTHLLKHLLIHHHPQRLTVMLTSSPHHSQHRRHQPLQLIANGRQAVTCLQL